MDFLFATDVLEVVPTSRLSTPIDEVAATLARCKPSDTQSKLASFASSEADAGVLSAIGDIVDGLSATAAAPVDARVVAVAVLCFSTFHAVPLPSPARQHLDTAFPGSSAPAASSATSGGSGEGSFEHLIAVDKQRRHFLDAVTPKLVDACVKHFGDSGKNTLQALAAVWGPSVFVVGRRSKQSAVAGSVGAVTKHTGAAVVVEACVDATVFVTAAVSRVVVRDCLRCRVVCVPADTAVCVVDCRACVITAAAPLVSMRNVRDSVVHTAALVPVLLSGDSAGNQLSYYNGVVPRLLESFPSLRPAAAAATAAAAAGSVGCPAFRLLAAGKEPPSTLPADKVGWAFLPVQAADAAAAEAGDRLPLKVTPVSPAAMAAAADMTGAAALRTEAMVQSAFTVSAACGCPSLAVSPCASSPSQLPLLAACP